MKDTDNETRLVGLIGVLLAGVGVWALVAPLSFFDTVATYEPYNRHLIQDIGAFQIGLGVVLLLAAWGGAGVVATAAIGVGFGSIAHLASHLVGIDDGGRPGFDIPSIGLLGVLLLWIGVRRMRVPDGRRE